MENKDGETITTTTIMQFRFLNTLDWYIIKKFLGTYFFSIALILSVAIIFDIQEKIEDFISGHVPLKEIIFNYYCNFVPYFANLFSSLFVFIAVIFFTSNMASHTEITAMHASGVSFNRFLRPYMVAASVIALFSWILIMYIIPNSNKVRLDFEDKYINGKWGNYDKDIHRQVQPNIYLYIESYRTEPKIGYKFALEKFDNGKLVSKMIADAVKWDSTKKKWTVQDYYIRTITGVKEKLVSGREIDTLFWVLPEDLAETDINVEKMTIKELEKFIALKELQGADNINTFKIQKYNRWAWPFSTFILTILGVCMSNRKRRGGIGVNIGLGLLLSFTYILFMQVSTTFSINSGLSPLLSVWIPNIIYGLVALILYRKAKI